MKKFLLSFILSVAAFAPGYADGCTGVLVDNGTQKTTICSRSSYYWSSTPGSTRAQGLNLTSGNAYVGVSNRYFGYSVRAVLAE